MAKTFNEFVLKLIDNESLSIKCGAVMIWFIVNASELDGNFIGPIIETKWP